MANYVTLVNQALRRVNEVELDIGGDGFADARNLQALAKDAINSAIREILQNSQEWPFTLTTYTQTLTPGIGVYDYAQMLLRLTGTLSTSSVYLLRVTHPLGYL